MRKNWFILVVKSRNELKVSERLTELGIEVYCPTVKELRVWSDRKKTIEVPLFKSYVFICLTERERQSVFTVPGVLRYLFWLGKPAIIRDEEMETLQKWLSHDDVEEVSIAKIKPGEEHIINYGILKNKTAIIQEVGKTRVKLTVRGLGMVINLSIKELV